MDIVEHVRLYKPYDFVNVHQGCPKNTIVQLDLSAHNTTGVSSGVSQPPTSEAHVTRTAGVSSLSFL